MPGLNPEKSAQRRKPTFYDGRTLAWFSEEAYGLTLKMAASVTLEVKPRLGTVSEMR